MSKAASVLLIDGATATGAGTPVEPWEPNRTFQAYGETTAGAGAATIDVEVSNVKVPGDNDWKALATLSLTLGVTRTSSIVAKNEGWRWVRGNVTAISGTGAKAYLAMGVC